jgi:hypothetical protein
VVAGGVAILEIKYFPETNRWHPHLHIVAEGHYIPHAILKTAWAKASRTSSIVDVRAIPRNDKVVQYVTKYATKPFDSSFIRLPERLDEAIIAMRGVRSVTTFGSWRGLKLSDVESTGLWLRVDDLHEVVKRHLAGETIHDGFFDRLHILHRKHLLDYVSTHAPPQSKRTTLDRIQSFVQCLLF